MSRNQPNASKIIKKRLEKDLDDLWSKIVHKQWGETCAWPGCKQTTRLAAHHYFHRSGGSKARWNINNGILLDFFHHFHEVHQRGNVEPIRDVLIQRLGIDGFCNLKRDVKGAWKPTIQELQDLKEAFRKLVSKF